MGSYFGEIVIFFAQLNSASLPRYQTQMKTSQASQNKVVKELALMRDESHLLKSKNEELMNQVDTQERELFQQKENLLREKELMVAKLEMLDDSSDGDHEDKDLQPDDIESEKTIDLQRKLEDVKNALEKEKRASDNLASKKEELEQMNLILKQSVFNEQVRTQQVEQDLQETKENIRQLKEELLRTSHSQQEKDLQTLKMEADLQSLRQKNTMLQSQLTRLQSEMSKSTMLQQKLKHDLDVKTSEKIIIDQELEELRGAAKEFACLEQDLKEQREENIHLKRETLKVEQLEKEREALETKARTLQLEVDLNTDRTEEIRKMKSEKDAMMIKLNNTVVENDQLTTRCDELTSSLLSLEQQVPLIKEEKKDAFEKLSEANKQIKGLEDKGVEQSQLLEQTKQENSKLKDKIDKLEKQFNDEKVDLGKVIQQLEKVQEKLLKDKNQGVSFKEELFEKVQNSDRENKEKLKILDSSLKHLEIKLTEQTAAKEACLRELEDLHEVEREEQNLIRLQKDKIRRMEMEVKELKEENKRKEETLNMCRMDLLQLEKEKGQLSAVSYENKALKENCALLEKSLDKFNDCQGRVSILEQTLFKSKEALHDKEEAIVDLRKSNEELKQKAKDANSNLAKERQEITRLTIALDASKSLVQRTEEKVAVLRDELDQFKLDYQKLKDEKTKLEGVYQGSVDAAAELKIHLENKHHMENVLEDRMKTLNAHLQEKNHSIDLIRKEKDQKEILHKSEINQLNNQLLNMQKQSSER